MIALFPDAKTDIAAAIEGKRQGYEWERRHHTVDHWLDILMVVCLSTEEGEQEYFRAVMLHLALSRAFESQAWSEVDAIIEAMEKEFA